jgi:hypothetical protein
MQVESFLAVVPLQGCQKEAIHAAHTPVRSIHQKYSTAPWYVHAGRPGRGPLGPWPYDCSWAQQIERVTEQQ